MSYYIEDDKKVIKTTRGYIFMCLGGDNNVTESKWIGGKKKWAEVRARSWCHLNHQILEATEPEIMAFCQRVYSGDPDYTVFKKGGRWICNKDMLNYFRDGMRRAQTLETLIRANRGQTLDGSVICYLDKHSLSRTEELVKYLHTTEELEQWLDQAKLLWEKYRAEGKDCYINLKFCGNTPLVYGCGENVGEVVVKTTSQKYPGYVCKYITDKSLSFTRELSKALIFSSEEDAKTAIGNCWTDIKFVSYASQVKANKPKPFLLLFGAGKLGGNYLQKTARNTVYGCTTADSAMKFPSEKEATRYAQKLRDKGWDENRCGKFTLVNKDTGCCTELTDI